MESLAHSLSLADCRPGVSPRPGAGPLALLPRSEIAGDRGCRTLHRVLDLARYAFEGGHDRRDVDRGDDLPGGIPHRGRHACDTRLVARHLDHVAVRPVDPQLLQQRLDRPRRQLRVGLQGGPGEPRQDVMLRQRREKRPDPEDRRADAGEKVEVGADAEGDGGDDSEEEDEPSPQKKSKTKEIPDSPVLKPYKPKNPYPQRLRKEKMEAQYGKFLDMIRAVRINVPLIDVIAGMPNYGKFLKELFSNKSKLEQISAAFLSDESSAII